MGGFAHGRSGESVMMGICDVMRSFGRCAPMIDSVMFSGIFDSSKQPVASDISRLLLIKAESVLLTLTVPQIRHVAVHAGLGASLHFVCLW